MIRKLLTVVVEGTCRGCCYRQGFRKPTGVARGAYCNKAARWFESYMIHPFQPIPDWCPLPDALLAEDAAREKGSE